MSLRSLLKAATLLKPETTDTSAAGAYAPILPGVGTYVLDGQGRVTTDIDGTVYTYDDANGGRIATITKNAVTRTAQYDASSNLTGWV